MVFIQLLPFFSALLLQSTTSYAANVFKVPVTSNLLDLSGLDLTKLPTTFNLFASKPHANTPNAPVRNDIVKVVTTVKAGNGQVFKDVLIDTGSAILWVGGEQPYSPGPYSRDMKTNFSVGYGAGGVSGEAFTDTVTIGQAEVASQIIGAANATNGFSLVKPIDGILGLGPTGSNAGEVEGFDTTPTFMDSLLAEKKIDQAIFGIFMTPLSIAGTPTGEGEITFGGVDQSKIRGNITWVPQRSPVNFHWEFNMTSFSFGPKVTLNTPSFTRTDTGVLGIGLPFDQFFGILQAFNGTLPEDSSKLDAFIALPSNLSISALPSLTFGIGKATFTIPPSKYIVPPELYPVLNITNDPTLVRTWISSAGPGAFSLGQKWLENVYTAYDLKKHMIGFAHVA